MMSSSDAIIWNIEKDPQLRSTVMAVWLLDQAPTPQRMEANIDRMVAAIPRLRQRVAEDRPRPRWEAVSDLRLQDHFVRQQIDGEISLDAAVDFAETWVHEPFDRQQPLWRLGLLTSATDGKAAVVIKVHHAIADGMGMVLMLGAFTDLERNPGPALVPVSPDESDRPTFTLRQRLRHKATAAAQSFKSEPVGQSVGVLATMRSAIKLVTPHRTPHSSLMAERSAVLRMETRELPFADFKAGAEASGVTLNDFFISIMADALTSYHEALGHECDKLRVHMPVDIRNERTATLAGNQFVPARVSLDLRAAPGRTRRSHIAMQLERLRDEPALGHINTVSAAIQRLGKPISRWIIGGMMKGVDVLSSNVPGPNFPLYLAGSKIETFFAFGPPAGAALNATLFSYDGSVGIGLTCDTAAMPQLDVFLASLDDVIATEVPAIGSALATPA
jgi:WS/DGAT/MGAT family acyltransferase